MEANGLNWCYNPNECGQACNDVCAVDGLQPVDNNVWFEAQNTVGECTAIADELGEGLTPTLQDSTVGCLEDSSGSHDAPGGLLGALFCSPDPDCPQIHRTEMGQLGVPCGSNSRRSICPCEQSQVVSPIPTISEWGLIAMAGILGIVGFMVIRRRKLTA